MHSAIQKVCLHSRSKDYDDYDAMKGLYVGAYHEIKHAGRGDQLLKLVTYIRDIILTTDNLSFNLLLGVVRLAGLQ